MGTWIIKSPEGYRMAMKRIQDKLNGITEGIKIESRVAVVKIVEECWKESAERAPKDLGDLRSSAYGAVDGRHSCGNTEAKIKSHAEPDKIVGEVGFDSEYAFVQHEHMEFHHENGQAKFLELTIVQNMSKWRQKLIDAARKAFKGG